MTQMDAPFKMQCVDRKAKRRRPAGKRLPDEVAEQLEGLLPDDALQDAVRGLDASEITGPGGLITQLAGRVIEAALAAELFWLTLQPRLRAVEQTHEEIREQDVLGRFSGIAIGDHGVRGAKTKRIGVANDGQWPSDCRPK